MLAPPEEAPQEALLGFDQDLDSMPTNVGGLLNQATIRTRLSLLANHNPCHNCGIHHIQRMHSTAPRPLNDPISRARPD
ncbi:hypothetical protein GJ744_007322 [Endocarpon pusillum]|uniref:Uncharacterized protein n=1 Tax=Endocarpon pusillum TaxID=364733 RepID=A0A8H7A7J0_9EURO|nr:hypothetical protein GJ744_007322 [Endocarpon pusillum]